VIASFVPLRWLKGYQPKWLTGDLVAGVTLAAYAVPVSLAYAGLAGLPPQVGLYGYLLGGIAYALFGSSRHLAVGPTSAISLMVATTVAAMSNGNAVRYAQIAALAALVVGGLSLIAWLLRLSALTSFISETILLGFKAGAGLSIASTQLAALIGVKGGGDHFFSRVWNVCTQLGDATPAIALVGLSALALILVGEKLLPGRPIALIIVVLSIVAVANTSLREHGVVTVGSIPRGLPDFQWPGLRIRDVDGLVPLALGVLLLAYIEGVSAARTFAEKHDYPLDARQELLGLAAANFATGLFGGHAVAGGLSQSAVNEKSGAKTPFSILVASGTIALCLLFLTDLVADLPKAVLSAIVLVAVSGLIKVKEIVRLRRVSRMEFRIAMIALVAVLLLGILKGILLAAIASILFLLHRAARPHVASLGRIPGTRRFSDLARHTDNEPVAGVLLVRVESSLLYFNAAHVAETVLKRVRAATAGLECVIFDLSASPTVDLAGAKMFERLHDELAKRRVALHLVEARSSVRELLRAEGLEAKVGKIDRFSTVADAVERVEAKGPAAPSG
jgi:high affinity sulfate transporter 1